MMKYQIQIPQIHCSGCINLIRMTLEENFKNIEIEETTKSATFESENNLEETTTILNSLFKNELNPAGYEYNNLKQINF